MSLGFDRAAWASSVRAPLLSPDLLNWRARSRDSLPDRTEPKIRHVNTIAEGAFMLSPPHFAGIKTSPSNLPHKEAWLDSTRPDLVAQLHRRKFRENLPGWG